MVSSLVPATSSNSCSVNGVRMAPSGRVIRSSNRGVIPASVLASSAVANSDVAHSRLTRSSRMRFLAICSVGISCGALLSLMAHPLDNLVLEGSSREILAAVRSNLINLEDDKPIGSPRQLRVQQALKRVTMQSDRPLEPVVESRPLQLSQRLVRLASYHSEAPIKVPVAAPENPAAIHSLRAVVGRVHSVIKKYAPKHQSAGSLAHSIVQESARQGVDPLFVAAVIKSESTFNSAAHSRKGAQGLMQIMPATGAWITEKNDLPRGRLTDPGHNLRLGISYLKHLEDSYNGNRVFALVAYNWGPGHVDSAAGGKRRIPKECMKYALKIIQDYKRWSAGVI